MDEIKQRVLIKWENNSGQSYRNENCAKMLVCMALSDRYRITQEKFLYHGVEIYMMLLAYTLYQMKF